MPDPDPQHWLLVWLMPSFAWRNVLDNTCTFAPSYRMHQKNKKETKAWYRCTRYESNQCRATAVVHISSGTLLKVTRSHVHSPGFLQDFARFENNFLIIVHGHMSSSLSLCTLSRWNIVVRVSTFYFIFCLHEVKELLKHMTNWVG